MRSRHPAINIGISVFVAMITLVLSNFVRHPRVSLVIEQIAGYGATNYSNARSSNDYSYFSLHVNHNFVPRGDLRNAMYGFYFRHTDVPSFRTYELEEIVTAEEVRETAIRSAIWDIDRLVPPLQFVYTYRGLKLLLKYIVGSNSGRSLMDGYNIEPNMPYSSDEQLLGFPSINYTLIAYLLSLISSGIIAKQLSVNKKELVPFEFVPVILIRSAALPFVFCCIFLFWFIVSSRLDLNILAPINTLPHFGIPTASITLAYFISFFAVSYMTIWSAALRRGLYRPRRADRCANCRYALPASGPTERPTERPIEGPGVGPSAESAAGPTAEPCPECGWDRVSVPKRAWRNLRRFAFGALALTVFFYLGPLWISWLAVIL